jgi:hypothetical protein
MLDDIGKLAEPMTKAVDALRSAVAVVFEPTAIRRRAEAEHDAAIIKAKGEIEVSELERRAVQRVDQQERRRQKNMESITQKAIDSITTDKAILALPGTTSTAKPDEDWIHQFFDYCKDIGDEEMQSVWGRLLAGEVAAPGTFSRLTLATMKTLSKKEAEIFTDLCKHIWKINGKSIILIKYFIASESINDYELNILASNGLILNVNTSVYITDQTEGNEIEYFSRKFIVSPHGNMTITEPAELTTVGKELSRIAGAESDPVYMQKVISTWRKWGFNVEPDL